MGQEVNEKWASFNNLFTLKWGQRQVFQNGVKVYFKVV